MKALKARRKASRREGPETSEAALVDDLSRIDEKTADVRIPLKAALANTPSFARPISTSPQLEGPETSEVCPRVRQKSHWRAAVDVRVPHKAALANTPSFTRPKACSGPLGHLPAPDRKDDEMVSGH